MRKRQSGHKDASIDNYKIDIAGREVLLTRFEEDAKGRKRKREEPAYTLYKGEYRGAELLFLLPEGGNPTPGKCAAISEKVAGLTGHRPIFILDSAPTYDRRRLMEKDVYFVMSGKYAYLPMLVALERTSARPMPRKLSAAAQYILLYHLQIEDIGGKPIGAIASLMPYSLESVSLGLTCLADLGLCEKAAIDAYSRTVRFAKSGRQLWDAAEKYMTSPVTRRYSCDTSGIGALTVNAPQTDYGNERRTIMTAQEFRRLREAGVEMLPYESEGDTVIEVWKYPPVRRKVETSPVADPLSIALTLREEKNPELREAADKAIRNFFGESIWETVQGRLRGFVSGPAKSGK